MIYIYVSVYHHILLFVDEHLTEQLKFDETWSCLVKHLNILTGRNLPLFDNTLIVLVDTNFVFVYIRIVFAIFLNESLCISFGGCQECDLFLENFLFSILRRIDIEHAWHHH